MRIVHLGDVVGRSGREAVIEAVPRLRRDLGLDAVVVCGENAAHGFGLTAKICQEFYDAGVDVVTTGNHVWDQRELIAYIDKDPRLLRPLNCPPGTPGRGATIMTTATGKRLLVAQVIGRLFMDPMDCPFRAAEALLDGQRLGAGVDAVVIDVHAEASSEKMAMAQFLDGRASLVAGTHSHVPTADAQVLPGGTAYVTDLGMCGDYDSVIGMRKEAAIARFTRKMPGERLAPADGPATVCGVMVETDDASGRALSVQPLRLGGRLHGTMPTV